MSVESIDEKRKLVPWEPKFELFGVALEASKGDTVLVRTATDFEIYYHRYCSRAPL